MEISSRLSPLVSVAVVAAFVLGACSKDDTTSSGDPKPEYEMLVILGDVANRPRDQQGRWRESQESDRMPQLTADELERLSELQTLPYVQGVKEAPDQTSVTLYDSERAYQGINVYTSGHAPEAVAMDMNGQVVHRWQMDIEEIFPEAPATIHSEFWRRVYWYPNGDILAIFEGIGIAKLNRFSRVVWKRRIGAHHEAVVADDGRIYVLTRRASVDERVNRVDPVLIDFVTVLDADGITLSEHSLLDAFYDSEFADVMGGMRRKGDLFHTNALEVFDGSAVDASPYYKKGNVLVSMLKLDTIAIVDLDSGKVVWADRGPVEARWAKQHDPGLLDNGNILLFDNRGRLGKSKVVELNPESGELEWVYWGTGENQLASFTCGTVERLPNGNTLITESDNGRALEVTPEQEIVWEFYNPHRAGDDGTLIATLFELIRLEPGFFPWLEVK